MKPDINAWNSFIETGRIDDYLDYCLSRKQEMFAAAAGGAQTQDATDHRRDCPQGYQIERG